MVLVFIVPQPAARERICTKGASWSLCPQSESEEVSTKLQDERPPLLSTSCLPCLPSPLPAQVQWWCLILFQQQQQLSQQEHKQQAERCGREVLLRRRHPLPDRQPGVGWGHRWAGSWCPGGGSSWPYHPRCPQRCPAEPGLLLWKEKEASQLWRTDIRRRRSGYRRRGEVFPSHRSRLHLQWKEKEASSWRE